MLASAGSTRTQADAGGEVLMLVRSVMMPTRFSSVKATFHLAWRSRQTWELDVDMLRLNARLSSGAHGAAGVAWAGLRLACEIPVQLH